MRSRICRVGNDRDVVFGEVDAGFHDGDQVNQFLLDGLQPLRQRAFELARRDLRLVERLRIDEVAHGFGLGEVDASVEEGAHGELAGLGEARAAGQRHFHDVTQHDGRAVAGDLDYIIGGVGVRLGEKGDDNFVDAIAGRGIDQFAEVSAIRLEFVACDSRSMGCAIAGRFSAGETHHADAAAAGRRGDGNDGVVEVHHCDYSPQRHGDTEKSNSGKKQRHGFLCASVSQW